MLPKGLVNIWVCLFIIRVCGQCNTNVGVSVYNEGCGQYNTNMGVSVYNEGVWSI